MILTTTPTIEGRRIVAYKGVVFGEVIAGVDFVRDIAARFCMQLKPLERKNAHSWCAFFCA